MKDTTYSYIVDCLERKAAEAQRLAGEYAEGEEYRESSWQDGRAQGIREALAMVYALDPSKEKYRDTNDHFTGYRGKAPVLTPHD